MDLLHKLSIFLHIDFCDTNPFTKYIIYKFDTIVNGKIYFFTIVPLSIPPTAISSFEHKLPI